MSPTRWDWTTPAKTGLTALPSSRGWRRKKWMRTESRLGEQRLGGWGGAEERGCRLFFGGFALDGLDGEEVAVRGDDDGGDAALLGGKEGVLGEGLALGEVGEWGEGGEVVADAEEEVAVAEVPEVLGVVVEVPVGACEDPGSGEFEEDGFDGAVHVVGRLVREAGDKFFDDEGEEEMLVVNVVDGEHGAAVEEELLGEGHEAEVFEGQAERLVWVFVLWAAGAGGGSSGEEEETGEGPAEEAMRCRVWGVGNQHGLRRVFHGADIPRGGVTVLPHLRCTVSQTRECGQCMPM